MTTASSTAARRRCGDCVACCDGSLRIQVFEHAVAPQHPCPYCTGHGCAIYERRPLDPCQQFLCGWLAPTSPLPEWMRPDRAGLIMLPAALRWRDLSVDLAVPTGTGPRAKSLNWLKAFSTRRRRPLLYRIGDDWYAHGPTEFQEEIRCQMAKGETPWDPSPSKPGSGTGGI